MLPLEWQRLYICLLLLAKGVRFNAYIENALQRKFHLQLHARESCCSWFILFGGLAHKVLKASYFAGLLVYPHHTVYPLMKWTRWNRIHFHTDKIDRYNTYYMHRENVNVASKIELSYRNHDKISNLF